MCPCDSDVWGQGRVCLFNIMETLCSQDVTVQISLQAKQGCLLTVEILAPLWERDKLNDCSLEEVTLWTKWRQA